MRRVGGGGEWGGVGSIMLIWVEVDMCIVKIFVVELPFPRVLLVGMWVDIGQKYRFLALLLFFCSPPPPSLSLSLCLSLCLSLSLCLGLRFLLCLHFHLLLFFKHRMHYSQEKLQWGTLHLNWFVSNNVESIPKHTLSKSAQLCW